MYDKDDTPEVMAALLAAMRAAIAWYQAAGAPGLALPPDSDPPTREEAAWRAAVAELARVGNEDPEKVEYNLRGNFMFYAHTVRSLHRDMDRACPNHREVADLCHGPFGELYLPFTDYMGMTNTEFLDFVVQLHRERHPGCAGFTATEAALAGCTTAGRRDLLVPWQ